MSCLSKAQAKTESRSTMHLDFIPIRMFPSRALIIIISSLTGTDRALFQRLRAYGYQALLVCPDPIDFARQTLAKDSTNRLAIRTARLERRLALRVLSGADEDGRLPEQLLRTDDVGDVDRRSCAPAVPVTTT